MLHRRVWEVINLRNKRNVAIKLKERLRDEGGMWKIAQRDSIEVGRGGFTSKRNRKSGRRWVLGQTISDILQTRVH